MAARTRQLRVEIVGDARRLGKTFDSIEKSTGRLSRGVSRFGTLAAAGLAAFAGGKVVGAIKSMVDEAREAERVGKTTEARLKSTGGVAGITAKQIEKLSASLSNKLGIDDEIIQSGANMMLTFKGVRDAAGRNNDIFTQATKLSVDLAAGMHQGQVTAEGLQGANIQLGKALEDPIKGITALRRVGVSFTQSQRDQIKTLVESGHTLEAQKIILKAVGDQFAGSAKAAATPWQRLGVVIGNIKERIGAALLPILDRVAKFMVDRFIPAAERFWKEHGPKFREIIRQIGELFSTKVGPAIRDFAENQGPRLAAILVRVGTFITKTVIPALAGMARWLNEHKTLAQSVAVGILAIIAAVKVWAAVTKTMAAVQVILNIALAANPVGLVILAIAALAAGIIYAYKHSKTFRDVVSKVFDFIRDKIATVVNFIIGVIRGWLNIQIGVVLGILRVMGKLPGPMGEPFRKAEEAVKKAGKTINDEIDKIQAKVNKIRGKEIPITVRASVEIAKSTRMYLAAANVPGFHAAGARIPGYGGGDIYPAMLEPGEAVVPKEKAATPAFRTWAGMQGIPGFQRGGVMGDLPGWNAAVITATERIGQRLADRLATAIGAGLSKALERAIPSISGVGAPSSRNRSTVLGIFASMFGWSSAAQRAATDQLLMHESGYRNTAQNPTSTAYGMFQFLNSTWAGTGIAKTSDPRLQAIAGGRYIAGRYGSPIGAWNFWQGHHWYDQGGFLPPGVSVAVNRTGRPERVLGPGEAPVSVTVNIGTVLGGDARKVARELEPAMSQAIREAQRRRGIAVTV